jgi:hypothetical protein
LVFVLGMLTLPGFSHLTTSNVQTITAQAVTRKSHVALEILFTFVDEGGFVPDANFSAPKDIRDNQDFYRNTRLPYAKFPRDPAV